MTDNHFPQQGPEYLVTKKTGWGPRIGICLSSAPLGPSGCVQASDGQLCKLSTGFCTVCPMSMGLGGQVSFVSFSVAVVTTQCLDSGPGPSSS